MRIEYEGEAYEFDMADITVKQAIKIEKHLGVPISEFAPMLAPEKGDPDMQALQCLGWLILHQGRGIPIEDTDFSVGKLLTAMGEAVAAEKTLAGPAEREPEPAGPTVAAMSLNGAAAAGPVTVP